MSRSAAAKRRATSPWEKPIVKSTDPKLPPVPPSREQPQENPGESKSQAALRRADFAGAHPEPTAVTPSAEQISEMADGPEDRVAAYERDKREIAIGVINDTGRGAYQTTYSNSSPAQVAAAVGQPAPTTLSDYAASMMRSGPRR